MKIMLISLFFSSQVFAGHDCPKTDKWLSEKDMRAKIHEYGFTPGKVKKDGNCWEMYGENDKKEKIEVYFHAGTGEILKTIPKH